VLVTRVFDIEIQRAILFWWYVAFDYCCGDHGFHGPGPELHDVAAIRLFVEEGQLQVVLTGNRFAT
jgi:hypothetical protein